MISFYPQLFFNEEVRAAVPRDLLKICLSSELFSKEHIFQKLFQLALSDDSFRVRCEIISLLELQA
jgi:HEAT repeat protein